MVGDRYLVTNKFLVSVSTNYVRGDGVGSSGTTYFFFRLCNPDPHQYHYRNERSQRDLFWKNMPSFIGLGLARRIVSLCEMGVFKRFLLVEPATNDTAFSI